MGGFRTQRLPGRARSHLETLLPWPRPLRVNFLAIGVGTRIWAWPGRRRRNRSWVGPPIADHASVLLGNKEVIDWEFPDDLLLTTASKLHIHPRLDPILRDLTLAIDYIKELLLHLGRVRLRLRDLHTKAIEIVIKRVVGALNSLHSPNPVSKL